MRKEMSLRRFNRGERQTEAERAQTEGEAGAVQTVQSIRTPPGWEQNLSAVPARSTKNTQEKRSKRKKLIPSIPGPSPNLPKHQKPCFSTPECLTPVASQTSPLPSLGPRGNKKSQNFLFLEDRPHRDDLPSGLPMQDRDRHWTKKEKQNWAENTCQTGDTICDSVSMGGGKVWS